MSKRHPEREPGAWGRIPVPMDVRFWSRVQQGPGCWLWTGTPGDDGYGRIKTPDRRHNIRAHRYSAMLHFGMFDRRLLVLHHCDVPLCVRPDHLYLGSQADNIRDMVARGRHRNGASR